MHATPQTNHPPQPPKRPRNLNCSGHPDHHNHTGSNRASRRASCDRPPRPRSLVICRWPCGRVRRRPASGSATVATCQTPTGIQARCFLRSRGKRSSPTAIPATSWLIRCAGSGRLWSRRFTQAAMPLASSWSSAGRRLRPQTSNTQHPWTLRHGTGDSRGRPQAARAVDNSSAPAASISILTSPPYACQVADLATGTCKAATGHCGVRTPPTTVPTAATSDTLAAIPTSPRWQTCTTPARAS